MLGRPLLEEQAHPADDRFFERRVNLHLPPPSYDTPATVSPPLTPAYERPDDFFPASDPDSDPSPSSDIWPNDDSLSAIERIYLYSRSRLPAHRAYIARHFATHLQGVDPQEAVDYVLPLVTELAIDEEGSVQEALASELSPALLWFFSECEMVEFSQETLQAVEGAAEEDDSPPPSEGAVSIQVVAALLATLLVSLRLNVAAAARRSVIDLLGKLSDTSDDHSLAIPTRIKRLIHQELILQVVIGVGKLDLSGGSGNECSEFDSCCQNDDDSVLPMFHSPSTATDHSTNTSSSNGIEDSSYLLTSSTSTVSEISESEADSSISGFHPEEIKLGRFSAMSMIATISGNDRGRLPLSNLLLFLREVRRVAEDQAYWIRSEAALAMGALAKVIPEELVYSILLPMHQGFIEDIHWRVRHSSLLALPNLLARLPLDRRKTLATSTLERLFRDSVKEVRSGVLEVLGETIYKFAPNCSNPHSAPPSKLVDMFLSRSEETVREMNSLPSIESTSSSSTPTSGSLRSLFERKTDNYARLTAAQEIDQKDLICAYNFPAVILTLGSQCWQGGLRDYYLKLWACPSYKIQHTLTASLAEVAEILGPENTKRDLLPCWKSSLRSDDSQIRQMSVRHFRPLYRSLPPFDRDEIFASLLLAWEGGLTGWRERLVVAELLPLLCERPEDEFTRLLGGVLRDPVAAVRLKAAELLPAIQQGILSRGATLQRVFEELKLLAMGSRHQFRTTFLDCFRMLSIDLSETSYLDLPAWLDDLKVLARDSVSGVRIGVARLTSRLYVHSHRSFPSASPILQEILDILQGDSVPEVRAYVVPLLNCFNSSPVPAFDSEIKAKFLGTPPMEFSKPPPISKLPTPEIGKDVIETNQGSEGDRQPSEEHSNLDEDVHGEEESLVSPHLSHDASPSLVSRQKLEEPDSGVTREGERAESATGSSRSSVAPKDDIQEAGDVDSPHSFHSLAASDLAPLEAVAEPFTSQSLQSTDSDSLVDYRLDPPPFDVTDSVLFDMGCERIERDPSIAEPTDGNEAAMITQSPGLDTQTPLPTSLDDRPSITPPSSDLIQLSPSFIELPTVKAFTPAGLGSLSELPSPAVAFLPTPLEPLAYTGNPDAYDQLSIIKMRNSPTESFNSRNNGLAQNESLNTALTEMDYFSPSFASAASAPNMIRVGSNDSDADTIATARSLTSPLQFEALDNLQGPQ